MHLTSFNNQKTILLFSYILLFVFLAGHDIVFAQQRQPVIAFASATQEPLLVEKFVHKHKHNLEATRMIFTLTKPTK